MTKVFQNLQLCEFSHKKTLGCCRNLVTLFFKKLRSGELGPFFFFPQKFPLYVSKISFWNTKNVKIGSTLVAAGSTFGSARATWAVDYWWRNTVVMWANYGEQCNDVNQQWEHQCSPLMPTHMSKEAFLAHCNATF